MRFASMRGLPAAAAVLALLLAGCGGGTSTTESTGSASTTVPGGGPAPTSGQSTRSCGVLTANDLVSVASIHPSKQGTLATAPGGKLRCSMLFVDSSGQLILQLTEADGGQAALTDLRRTTAAEVGPGAIHPVAKFGPGAFVGSRVLGFIHGSRLVTLQTGYTTSGELELTPDQLVQLATIVRGN